VIPVVMHHAKPRYCRRAKDIEVHDLAVAKEVASVDSNEFQLASAQ
jgi:hypothetical protein